MRLTAINPLSRATWEVKSTNFVTLAGSMNGLMAPYCGHVKNVYGCDRDADHITEDNIEVTHFDCNNIICPVCRKAISKARAYEAVDILEGKIRALWEVDIRFPDLSFGTCTINPGRGKPYIATPKTFNALRHSLKKAMKRAGCKASMELSHLFSLTPEGREAFTEA